MWTEYLATSEIGDNDMFRHENAGRFPADVSIGIISHNSREELPATLAAIEAVGCPPIRVFVADNASTDGTQDWLADQYPEIRTLNLDRNEGPNPARNRVLREARTRYVLLVDDDVRIRPDTVMRLRRTMQEDPNILIAVPVVVKVNSPNEIQYAQTNLHFLCEAVNTWQGRKVSEFTSVEDLVNANGCASLLDRDRALALGGYDERMFFGKTDTEFSYRARVAGHRVVCVNSAIVTHNVAERGRRMYCHQLRSRWYFILKNYQLSTLLAILPILIVYECMLFLLMLSLLELATYLRALGGLFRLIPAIRKARRSVALIRRVPDKNLLSSGPLYLRPDILSGEMASKLKDLGDQFLRAYWEFSRSILLRWQGSGSFKRSQ